MSEPITNVVLVGRTGNGKSATGNMILGQNLFASKLKAGGVTIECEMYRAAIQDGPIINVIDTPGLCDSAMSEENISTEIINCLTMVEEGIHAVLFVLSTRNRISQEEESTLETLECIFDRKILDYVIVVFTGGDELEAGNQTLDDYLRDGCPQFLTRVLKLCGGRKVLVNNRTTDKAKRVKQVRQLLAHIADVGKQNGGKPYTDRMHRQIKESKKLAAEAAEAEAAHNLILEYDEKMRRKLQLLERRLNRILKLKEVVHVRPPQDVPAFNPLPHFRAPTLECNIM